MSTNRTAALAFTLTCIAGSPALAATCNLTVLGASVLDDEPCTMTSSRGITRFLAEDGGTVVVRRSVMSARLPAPAVTSRRRRPVPVSYGQVVTSNDSDDKTCYFNQKAVLCVEQ